MSKYKILERFILSIYNLKYKSKHYKSAFNLYPRGGDDVLSIRPGGRREDWLLSAEYLLEGIFRYVKTFDSPLLFPKQIGKSYPKIIKGSKKVAYLEGLCRSLFVASPFLREKPDLVLYNIPVADYYRNQLSKLVESSSLVYVPDREVDYPSQYLVEFGGLAISFFLNKENLWNPLDQEVKDKLAFKMLSYGEGPYVDNNWKYFSVFILSFFQSEGYKVDENRLELLLDKILCDYSGDGWYLDDSFDYYSMWGYQLYAVIWSKYYGEKMYAKIAERLKGNFKAMLTFYPYLFARDGKMLMWGRSITYRYAALAPLLFSSWVSENVNHGWIKRICFGALQQFWKNKAFLKCGIPSLGFYGAFEPCVQAYSCRASSFWLGKAYLGLMNPPSDPLWNQQENDGPWANYQANQCYAYYSESGKMMVTHYSSTGETEIRTSSSRDLKKAAEYMRNENYNRLAYHTAFPWQADTKKGCVAMNYLVKEQTGEWEPLRQYELVFYHDGFLRRKVRLETYSDTEIDLVDFPLPNGVLRIDKVKTAHKKQVRLGHYALPEKLGNVKESVVHTNNGLGKCLDNGEWQLLAVPVLGWHDLITIRSRGIHPESKKSAVINLLSTVKDETVLITLLLFKKSRDAWSRDEYDVIEKVDVRANEIIVELANKKLLNWTW